MAGLPNVKKHFLFSLLSLAVAANAFAYRHSAWIPPWNSNALTSLQTHLGALSETNPVWYAWNADGTIAKVWNAENATWRAAMTGTQIIPTVQNVVNNSFNGSVAATVLGTPESRDAHASAIAQLATQNAYDGIDIDYEKLPASARANFTAFLQALAQKLHAANKKLSVTVYAKTSDSQNWSGPGAEDWPAIGQIADSVKIMAYDYSWSTSAPGPIAPLEWLDQVATYAQGVIPAAKIMMGLPWYGYDWNSAGATANMSYSAATLLAQNNGATVSHDVNGEATFTFSTHTVYFQDASSYSKKIALLQAKHSAIGGFAAWAAGQEDPAIWTILRGGSVSTPATPPPSAPPLPAADFTISGPSALTVAAGSTTTGAYRIASVNGFVATTNLAVDSPAGLAASIDPALNLGGVATLRVAATSATKPGSYDVTLHFTSGTLSHAYTVNVTVALAPRRRVVSR